MRNSSTSCVIGTAIAIFILAGIAFLVNLLIYQYPGNNYFPPYSTYIAFVLLLIYLGHALQRGRTGRLASMIKEIIYFFLVMSLIAYATNAIQYTPFPPIDKQIIAIERSIHINMATIISWTHKHNVFTNVLAFIYDSLPYQMSYFPLFVIGIRGLQAKTPHFPELREYYFLLLFSALIGFSIYYFFPTTAPASLITSPYFGPAQKATGLKFSQIHHYIQPTTLDGGMIALPSFHAIWAWLCLYLLRGWPLAFIIMLPVNILLVASCVLLGWHYPMDILGSLIIILISHWAYCFCKKQALI